MANLTETSTYDAGVYQIEIADPVSGGSTGIANKPLKNLANRTAYLKAHVDSLETALSGTVTLTSPVFTGDPKAPTPTPGDNDTSIATTAFVNAAITAGTAGDALKLGGVLASNYAVKASVVAFDDLTTFRVGAVTTGFLFFGNTGTKSLSWDATNFNLNGPLISTGNITGYSDERLKTNWRDLPGDFTAQLAGVKMGVYDRTDEPVTQIGVSAQSLRDVMPQAVIEDGAGMLSVAYGNAALAACVALAREVELLKARLAAVEAT